MSTSTSSPSRGARTSDSEKAALSIVDSNDDVFAEYLDSQVELVAHALGRGARAMLYLRAEDDAGSLRLAEVSCYPKRRPHSSSGENWNEDHDEDDDDGDYAHSLERLSGESGGDAARDAAAETSQAITLSGRGGSFDGSVDEFDVEGGATTTSQQTNAEALLVKQRVFALPSTNALVVPLSRDNALVGLLVGEMPEGGGWKRRVSARTRAKRAKEGSIGFESEPEVEVLEEAAGAKDAADTAEVFGDRRQAALTAAARAIVAAWAMHRRADYATAAAVRSDRRVAGFTYAAKEPLTALKTLGGMLSSHLKPDTPSWDMAEAMLAQGETLASLSEELESALYPASAVEELASGARGLGSGSAGLGQRRGMSAGLPSGERARRAPLLPAPGTTTTSTTTRGAIGASCDVTPIVAGLLASSEVLAKPAGVTMTATFPPPPTKALVAADSRDVHEALALVIDAMLVAAPKGAEVTVVVGANGGAKGGVVVAASVTAHGDDDSCRAGALADAVDGLDLDAKSAGETRSLKIARSLVEDAGGIFHASPSPPPRTARVELWLPAAAAAAAASYDEDDDAEEEGGEEEEDDAVDV